MAQQVIDAKQAEAKVGRENVIESWVMYDSVLCCADLSTYFTYRDGWFTSFDGMSATATIPFFNVRNRNHGIMWNNQDTRDQLAYVMKIYSIGVSFFAPSTSTYTASSSGEQRYAHDCWEAELPKHCSLALQTNQDVRLEIPTIMAPPGYGIQAAGVAQGDVETAWSIPPTIKNNFNQGMPELTNVWGFKNPLEVPRRANLSVKIDLTEYARNLLDAMPGPYYQRLLTTGAMWSAYPGVFGIQVTLGGVREVQQRGQYAA